MYPHYTTVVNGLIQLKKGFLRERALECLCFPVRPVDVCFAVPLLSSYLVFGTERVSLDERWSFGRVVERF
jgi:hypothetical protein